ncbi:MAG: PLP-dependent transferase [Opitutaceae bacterium]|nr:PLP-dependent transferase [Cytophagales bacterium]
MDRSTISLINIKNVFNKYFNRKTDTIAVNEFTQSHQQLNDPRYSFLEQRIASLEGGVDALAVKSLRSARFKLIISLLEKGENVVTFNSIILAKEDKALYDRLGIQIRLPEDGSLETFFSLIDEKTKLIYLEIISSHFINVPDFIKIIQHAESLEIPVVVDNTGSAGGYLFKPLMHRANIVIESLEDFLPPSTKQKAVIVDGGNYDWFNGNYNRLAWSKLHYYHLLDEQEASIDITLPNLHLVDFLRKKSNNGHNDYPIPQDPFSLIKKLEEIPEKIKLRSENAYKLNQFLKQNKHILHVEYTGDPNGKSYFEALKYLKHGFGYYLSFTLNEQPAIAGKFFEILKRHSAFKNRLTYDTGKSKGYLSVPGVEFEELQENFETSFAALAEIIRNQILIHNPLLELV